MKKGIIIGAVVLTGVFTTLNKRLEQGLIDFRNSQESYQEVYDEITIKGEDVLADNLIEKITEKEVKENLKCGNGIAKTYMEYSLITDPTSKQYNYIREHMTVNEKGYLVDKDGRIGIALGSYFGEIGSKFDITLENGTVLKVIKIEAKADAHTNNGCEQRWDKSIIEFVIDTKKAKEHYGVAKNGYINQGNYNNLTEFNGAIKSIYKVD